MQTSQVPFSNLDLQNGDDKGRERLQNIKYILHRSRIRILSPRYIRPHFLYIKPNPGSNLRRPTSGTPPRPRTSIITRSSGISAAADPFAECLGSDDKETADFQEDFQGAAGCFDLFVDVPRFQQVCVLRHVLGNHEASGAVDDEALEVLQEKVAGSEGDFC